MCRTIVVGDIHGCGDELERLLEECGRTPEDEVVSVGDLVDRGPQPMKVVDFFRSDPNALAVLGNHEDKHVRWRRGELKPSLSQRIARLQMGDGWDAAVEWFETIPLWMERHGCLIVHAGVVPGVPIAGQPRNALLRGKMPWMASPFDVSGPDWRDLYDGSMPVIFGHRSFARVARVGNTWGIDTGACYGHSLSALILPSFEVVEVRASRDHWEATRLLHRSLEPEEPVEQVIPQPVRQPVVIQDRKIDGRYLMSLTGKSPGPWIGKAIAAIREGFESGAVDSLPRLHELVEGLFEEVNDDRV